MWWWEGERGQMEGREQVGPIGGAAQAGEQRQKPRRNLGQILTSYPSPGSSDLGARSCATDWGCWMLPGGGGREIFYPFPSSMAAAQSPRLNMGRHVGLRIPARVWIAVPLGF